MISWFMISVAVLLALLLFYINKGKKHKPDYYSFFIIGIIWVATGVPLKNYVLSAMGAVFLIVGLTNKKKWKQNHRSFNKLSKKEKKQKIILMIILLAILLLGVIAFLTFA